MSVSFLIVVGQGCQDTYLPTRVCKRTPLLFLWFFSFPDYLLVFPLPFFLFFFLSLHGGVRNAQL